MLTVQPLCKLMIMTVAIAVQMFFYFLTRQTVVLALLRTVSLWLWLYLSNLKIKIENQIIVKKSGNIFKHKSYIMLKNTYSAQITTVAPWRPALVRLHAVGDEMFIIGLNGRQALFIEKQITDMNKY